MITDALPHISDMVLILISGLACLYCAILSRRLKNLNNLKTGVGASIISLTQAIEDTHKAAQEAQNSTLQTVQTLRHLLDKAESAAPRIEALIAELEHSSDKAGHQRRQLDNIVETSLSPAINKAQRTAASLHKVVSVLNRQKDTLNHSGNLDRGAPSPTIVKLQAG